MEIKANTHYSETSNIRSHRNISTYFWHRSANLYPNPTSTNGESKNETLKTYNKISITLKSLKQHRTKNKMGNSISYIRSNLKTFTILAKCIFRTPTSRSPNYTIFRTSIMGNRRTQLPHICTYIPNVKRPTRIKRCTSPITKALTHAQGFGCGYVLACTTDTIPNSTSNIKNKYSRQNLGGKVQPTKRIKLCMRLWRMLRIKSQTRNTPMEQPWII